MSSTLQISVRYKLLLWILPFCDCSKFKYLFLTERIYYSGELKSIASDVEAALLKPIICSLL